MQKLDLKRALKPLYSARTTPSLIEVPSLQFLMIDGAGDPNTSREYADTLAALYAVAYTLKFQVKKELGIDYPVMALEGLWWTEDMDAFSIERKGDWQWTMMISTPDLVTPELVEAACQEAGRKKDLPVLPRLRFERFAEGLSAQVMHLGPYSAEAPTIAGLHEFIHAQGCVFDGRRQKHHEIYLSDPRRSAPDKMKTIIRQPVSRPA